MTSIVSAYNHKIEMTLEFLDCMQRTTEGQDVEMILVNGGNPIKIEHPFVTRRIDLPTNIGFCHTLNQGLAVAAGNLTANHYIFFVGNDSFPVDKDWLPRLIELHSRTGAYMTCPANDNPGMEYRKDCYTRDCGDHWEANWFPSIAWLMDIISFLHIGYLDEGYVRTGMFADNDYCDRIRAVGGKIVVSKDIMLRHLCSQEGAVHGTQGADMHTNSIYYHQKCREREAEKCEAEMRKVGL